MDALQAIRTRRSIRVYQDKPVPEELVQQILAAAMYAPSAGNAQPWQFVVVNDRKLLQQIPKVHPHARGPWLPCRAAGRRGPVRGKPDPFQRLVGRQGHRTRTPCRTSST